MDFSQQILGFELIKLDIDKRITDFWLQSIVAKQRMIKSNERMNDLKLQSGKCNFRMNDIQEQAIDFCNRVISNKELPIDLEGQKIIPEKRKPV